jgi:hypothetical protein
MDDDEEKGISRISVTQREETATRKRSEMKTKHRSGTGQGKIAAAQTERT